MKDLDITLNTTKVHIEKIIQGKHVINIRDALGELTPSAREVKIVEKNNCKHIKSLHFYTARYQQH